MGRSIEMKLELSGFLEEKFNDGIKKIEIIWIYIKCRCTIRYHSWRKFFTIPVIKKNRARFHILEEYGFISHEEDKLSKKELKDELDDLRKLHLMLLDENEKFKKEIFELKSLLSLNNKDDLKANKSIEQSMSLPSEKLDN